MLAPAPMVVAVLLVRLSDAAVFDVSVTSSLPAGAVVPIPILELVVSKFIRPDSILRAIAEELTRSHVEALTDESVAALMVKLSPDASPIVKFPSILAVPFTSKSYPGAVIPIPSLPVSVTTTLVALLA